MKFSAISIIDRVNISCKARNAESGELRETNHSMKVEKLTIKVHTDSKNIQIELEVEFYIMTSILVFYNAYL